MAEIAGAVSPSDEMRAAATALREDAYGTAVGRMHVCLAFELISLLEDGADDVAANGGFVQSASEDHAPKIARLINGSPS